MLVDVVEVFDVLSDIGVFDADIGTASGGGVEDPNELGRTIVFGGWGKEGGEVGG